MAGFREILTEVFHDHQFWIAFVCITLYPIYWNSVGRLEYYTGYVSKIFCGDKRGAVRVFGCSILCFSAIRAVTIQLAIKSGPKLEVMDTLPVDIMGISIACLGLLFILSSFWQLGFFGTFLGDHFGILMSAPVTGFPFNVLSHPMYWGAIMLFYGEALYVANLSGLVLAAWVHVTYRLAMSFEEPMTERIYSTAQRKDQ